MDETAMEGSKTCQTEECETAGGAADSDRQRAADSGRVRLAHDLHLIISDLALLAVPSDRAARILHATNPRCLFVHAPAIAVAESSLLLCESRRPPQYTLRSRSRWRHLSHASRSLVRLFLPSARPLVAAPNMCALLQNLETLGVES
jgi:hypothetical protein